MKQNKQEQGVEPLIEVLEKTIEFNTDSVIGEDGTIVVDYAQLRDALFSAMNTYTAQSRQEAVEEEQNKDFGKMFFDKVNKEKPYFTERIIKEIDEELKSLSSKEI